MKEKLRNKKVVYTIIGIVSVLLVALAVTYAYWLVTKTQDKENEIAAGCLDITISGEKNDIELTNQFPMSDEDGMKLVPYEFTVTNNCNTSVDYQVALEATGTESSAITTSSLKVALNDTVTLLSSNPEIDTTVSGTYESRTIGFGTLKASGNEESSDTHSLRIWIDKDAPISEMNKTFKSKISVTIGQGIFNPYKEGTLAYNILSNNGGIESISEIDATKYSHLPYEASDEFGEYISDSNNYYYGTDYTFDEATGKYTLSGTLTQAETSECRKGTKTCGKYTLFNESSTYSAKTLYEVINFINDSYVNVVKISYILPFASITTANEAGLYKISDDLGNSYYYRGTPTNNYVEFGAYNNDLYLYDGCAEGGDGEVCYGGYMTLEACEADKEEYGYTKCITNLVASAGDAMYWKIVRINGDGTIRLIYDGISKNLNGTKHYSSIGSTPFNYKIDNAKYVGYTYDDGNGNQVDSAIKGALDTWYENNLASNYGKYIADSIFCNDRTISSVEDSGETYYGAYKRLRTDKAPSLKCPNQSDRYTVDDTANGNGLLSNPIGLITADEMNLAGANSAGNNSNYYLYGSGAYWTLTPVSFGSRWAFGYRDNGNGLYFGDGSELKVGLDVRPVINLKADVEFTGDGSFETPYKIVTE